jgi:hypothetical protein
MANLKFTYFAALVGFILLLAACNPTKKLQKNADPEARILGIWEITTLEKGGRDIDVVSIAGEVFMEFFRYEKKDKEGKLKVTYRFRMEMGGSDRVFDFKLVADSVQFQEVKGWNDFKIITLEREGAGLVLEQDMDGDMIRWKGKARPDLDEEKAKTKKAEEKAKKDEGKNKKPSDATRSTKSSTR